MAVKNPYTSKGMLPMDSGIFFGRQKEMRRIRDLLIEDTPQCVSIIDHSYLSLLYFVLVRDKLLKSPTASA